MGVHHVVTPPAHEPGQPPHRPQVRVAAHADPVHGQAVALDGVGEHASAGQHRHLAPGPQPGQQDAQLLLRAARRQPGDDVQDPHRPHLTRWRARFTLSRSPPSRSPT